MFYYYSHLFQLNAGWFYNSSREPVWVSHHSEQDGSSQAGGEERKVSGLTEALITVYSCRAGWDGIERGCESLIVLIKAVRQVMFLTKKLTLCGETIHFSFTFWSKWTKSALTRLYRRHLIKKWHTLRIYFDGYFLDDDNKLKHDRNIYWFFHRDWFIMMPRQ